MPMFLGPGGLDLTQCSCNTNLDMPVIDAGYVHKVADRVLDVISEFPPPDTLGGQYMLRGYVRQIVSWFSLIARNGFEHACRTEDPHHKRCHRRRLRP